MATTTVFGAVDLYEVLGVAHDVPASDIVSAYRKLARLYHPDRCEQSAETTDKFQRIQEAHEVLQNAERRALFDEARKTWLFNRMSLEERLAGIDWAY